MTDERITELLGLDRVAVIGCSSASGKDAHEIPRYLLEQGYDVIPVNPYADEIFGKQAHDSLTEITEPVDLVTVFRPGDEVPEIVETVLTRRDQRGRDDPGGLWLQLGITNQPAIARARNAGMTAVQDHCMKVEHQRVLGST
jgi:Predicted CoA-binding protein